MRSVAISVALIASSVGLANANTWSLTSGTLSPSNHPYGNVLNVSSSGETIEVTGWSTNNPSAGFQNGAIYQYNPYGIGLCDRGESGSACNPPDHTFDNHGRDDFALIMFDESMNIGSVDITGFGDTDVTYFVGTGPFTTGTWNIANLNPSISALQTAGATGVIEVNQLGPDLNSTSRTVNINATGNFILIGAALDPGCTTTYSSKSHSSHGKPPKTTCDYDYFKIKSISANDLPPPPPTVPEPATWSLMILAFGALGIARRRAVRA